MTQKIQDPLDRDLAPGWIHEESGDRVRGPVVDLGTYDGGYGPYPVVTIRLAEGYRARVAEKHGGWVEPGDELAIHCAPTVLRNEMAKAAPEIGNEIGVRRGEMVDGARNPYPRFKVVNYDRQTALDWSKFGSDDEDPGPISDVPVDTADLPERAVRPQEGGEDDLFPPN